MQKFNLVYLFLILILVGCDVPIQIKLPDEAKNLDGYSRDFISHIISNQPNKALQMMDSNRINDQVREYLYDLSSRINNEKVIATRIVGYNSSRGFFTGYSKFINYELGYEYEFDKGNILFIARFNESDGKITITGFNGNFLKAPLSELTKFTLKDKSIIHYIFLTSGILIPIFIIGTFFIMLSTNISIKRKVIWSLLILFISAPRFVIDWNYGDLDYNLLNFNLLGIDFGRPNLYTNWVLGVRIPFGAIWFWLEKSRH